jgi:hypothetical protein
MPVNSFRVILNAYFHGRLEVLADEKYLTVDHKDYYDVERITEDAVACLPK